MSESGPEWPGRLPGKLPIAFWLIPAQPQLDQFRALISSLAREYDAPVFEPHITLHVGLRTARDDIAELLRRVAAASEPIPLVAGNTSHSDALFKTLFVEFYDSKIRDSELRALHCQFQAGLQRFSEYALASHLSLLYKEVPAGSRAALAERHVYAGQRIVFDTVAAVRPAPEQSDWSEIQRWDSSLRRSLRPTQA
ncbi:MAG: 2'-5' RNA ligase family protein [Burkholderiales bacterium]